MNSSPRQSPTATVTQQAITVLGLLAALYGMANVMPAIGDFRLGPFPMEMFRASFFALCAVLVGLSMVDDPMGNTKPWVKMASVAAVVAILYSCWSFYQVSVKLDEDMFLFGLREAGIAMSVAAASLFFCWRLWGGPVALLGIAGIAYLLTGEYWPGAMRLVTGDIHELLAQNLWYSLDTGILGATFSIVISTVLPFIVLGALLEGVGAGESMIRIAFSMMRKTAGGPAHAAVLASGLFGSVSGSAVANVVGTGVITIPMIKRRGFSNKFAGAVEAAASTGGQIMPPIMGAAALVMADYVGVSYLTVVVAVLVPAIAFYASLFLMIIFEARREGITPQDTDAELAKPSRQDVLNLVLVFGPLGLIVLMLIDGWSPAGASMAAIAMLFPMSLINPRIRHQPGLLLKALSNGGKTFAQLLTAIAAISIVISVLSATGMPVKFGVLMSTLLDQSLFIALLVVAGGCILLGMGMPTLPAYVTVAAIALPSMEQLGLAPLNAHMFVFMIAVASTITPPVAIAAYAAASIAQSRPIETAVSASRIGVMIFIIPFAFAYNPLLLTVAQAGGQFTWPSYIYLIFKLVVAMYLVATALSRWELHPLDYLSIALRLVAAVLLLVPLAVYDYGGFALGAALLMAHRLSPQPTKQNIQRT